ncbi:MAG: tol-pal system protein YbgF [Gammaproteobacteria bacterium]|nr:tol-pal system protein YbgF [Gammaproteobacteria bacterium]
MRRQLLAALLLLASLPAQAQSTRERLESLELQVAQLQEVLRGQALVELSQRLDALAAEVRALRGDLDVLQRENEARRQQQTDFAVEFDRRMAPIESRMTTATAVTGGPTPAATSIADGPTLPSPSAQGTSTTTETPEVVYGRAFDALKAANYPDAITGMSGFIAQFPSHPLANNAHYWLGQTYFVTRDYERAIDSFAAVGTSSPDSSKAPDALLKKGLAEVSLGRNDAARISLSEVIRRYPQNDAARLAREQLVRMR